MLYCIYTRYSLPFEAGGPRIHSRSDCTSTIKLSYEFFSRESPVPTIRVSVRVTPRSQRGHWVSECRAT